MADPIGRIALGYSNAYEDAYKTAIETKSKYATINSLEKDQKIQALKDVKLDPHSIQNPHDAIAQSLNRWKTVAADSTKYTPEQQRQIASNYYDREVAPFYTKLGVPGALPKESWMSQAYNPHGALAYNVEDSFHSWPINAIHRGLSSTATQLENLGGTLTNMLGLGVHVAGDLARDVALSATENFSSKIPQYSDIAKWHDHLLADKTADEAKYSGNEGFFKTAQAITQGFSKPEGDKTWLESPTQTLAHDSKIFSKYAAQDEFWSHVNPAQGFVDAATSTTIEMAATLPMFGAIKGGMETLGLSEVGNLTKVLGATTRGKVAAAALINGSEGLAYGVLTRPNEDKIQAWKDALAFAAWGTMFKYAGEKLKLRDQINKSGTPSEIKDANDDFERVRMSAEDNKVPASAAERRAAYIKEHASNISVGGVETQRAIYRQAVEHIISDHTSGKSDEAIKATEDNFLKEDPAHAAPVLSAKAFIKDYLNGRKISSLNKADLKDLGNQIGHIINDSVDHLNRSSKLVQNATKARSNPDPSKPGTKLTLATFLAKAQKEAKDQGVEAHVKPEEIMALAKKMYADAEAKAAGRSEHYRTSDPHEEALDAAETRTRKDGQQSKAASKSETKPATKAGLKSEKYGLPANASASHNTNYMTYLRGKVPDLKPKELSSFYEGMEASDFNKDLEEFFYPKDLKESGLYFEHEETREGKDNPNFLAFMYNYKDQMPKELGEEVSRRLEDSLKFEKHFKGYRITEDQKWHYALQMYNHVDTFLNSTSFAKGERNIFRSTQSDLLNPTKYQKELLQEMHSQNLKTISEMFPNPRAKTAARNAYKILAGELDATFAEKPSIKSALKFRAQKENMDEQLIQDSGGSLIPWRF